MLVDFRHQRKENNQILDSVEEKLFLKVTINTTDKIKIQMVNLLELLSLYLHCVRKCWERAQWWSTCLARAKPQFSPWLKKKGGCSGVEMHSLKRVCICLHQFLSGQEKDSMYVKGKGTIANHQRTSKRMINLNTASLEISFLTLGISLSHGM